MERCRQIAVVAAVVLAAPLLASCAAALPSITHNASPTASSKDPTPTLTTGSRNVRTYSSAPRRLTELAAAVTTAWFAYDTRRPTGHGIATGLADHCTSEVARALARRAEPHRDWPAMVARREWASLSHVDASLHRPIGSRSLVLIVNGLLVTRSAIGRLTTPVTLTLRMSRERRHWVVIDVNRSHP